MFTARMATAQTWTLNPLVPGTVHSMLIRMTLSLMQEFSSIGQPSYREIIQLTQLPMYIDGDLNDPTQKGLRVYTIILDKGPRGTMYLDEFQEWQSQE